MRKSLAEIIDAQNMRRYGTKSPGMFDVPLSEKFGAYEAILGKPSHEEVKEKAAAAEKFKVMAEELPSYKPYTAPTEELKMSAAGMKQQSKYLSKNTHSKSKPLIKKNSKT